MSLLNWFKPLTKASTEGGQSTTAESAGIEQPLIES